MASRPSRKVEVFRDASKRWRWHSKSRNGKITGDSGQGYRTPSEAERAAAREYPTAKVVRLPIGDQPVTLP